MKLRIHSTLFACAVLFLVGCNRPAPSAAKPSNPLLFSAQLEAALSITNPIQRDEALAAVARTAGEAGDGEIALAAIVAMQNPNFKDNTAVLAAKKLAKAGNGPKATAIAKIIQNPNLRDSTLLELSKM